MVPWRIPSLLVALALAGCGHPTAVVPPAASGTRPATVATGVHSEAAATRLARSLLHRAVLPPGAATLDRPPTGALARAPQHPATPNLGHATTWARSGEAMRAVTTWFLQHRPRGWVQAGSGSGQSSGPSGVTSETVIDALGGMPPGVQAAQLLLTVAPLRAGGSGIRVDAQVTWTAPKPKAASVPATDRAAVVSIVETLPAKVWKRQHLPAPRRVVVTAPATVEALRSAADGLAMALPGAVSCPADAGTRYIVAFAPSARSRPDRSYTAGSCDLVTVTGATGRRIAVLADNPVFDRAYQRVLGRHGP